MNNELLSKILSQNLVDQANGKTTDLFEGLQIIPAGKIFELIQYFTENLLPKIEVNKGVESVDYKNMSTVVHSLLYAVKLMEVNEGLRKKNSQLKLWCRSWQMIAEHNEKELEKYTTVESLMYAGDLDKVRETVLKKGIEWAKDAIQARNSLLKK